MSIEIYPSTPKPSYSYILKKQFKTLVDEFGENELSRYQQRFPRRPVELKYNYLTVAQRNTIENFFQKRKGMTEPFWFVDFESRGWVDEYVGRGGPLNLKGAISDDGGSQSNETTACINATANGMTFLPVAPALNDAYYFGSNTQFDKLIVIIGTSGTPAYVNGVSGWLLDWEYWDGNSWESLAGVSDLTIGFTAAPGSHEVTFTIPVDWAIYEIGGFNAYWVRARVDDFETCIVQPKGSGTTSNSKTYDLHGIGTTSQSIYIDSVLKTGGGADYTLVSGGGAAGADRITFVNYPAVGSLITSDHTGQLRIKARFGNDELKEEETPVHFINIEIPLKEVHW